MSAGQKVTYACVYFGSYPQAEVISSRSKAITIAKEIRSGHDYIIDSKLYKKLKNAKKWNKNGDIVIDGQKYRRIKVADATRKKSGKDDKNNYYQWDASYHYFKYQPIKWRVLYKNDAEMLLVADVALDCQKYNTQRVGVTWADSTLRSWLNGYGKGSNAQGISYKNKNFADTAFSQNQYDTIINGKVKNINNQEYDTAGGRDTKDRIFLLSEKQVYTDSTGKYGFISDRGVADEARRTKSSAYAKAMGCWSNTESAYAGNCIYFLRSPGSNSRIAAIANSYGQAGSGSVVVNDDHGIRPALRINLKVKAQYKYAGTVCTDGIVK